MASFEPIDQFGDFAPPPRPTTPAVRRGFLLVLALLTIAVVLVYGVPFVVRRTAYAYEEGRARAASDALARLDDAGVLGRSSALFRLASQKVSPAVVNIGSLRTVRNRRGVSLTPVGAGSGFVIDKELGLVVTNHHVIKDGEEYVVRLGRGDELSAKLVGSDQKTDIAVLKVERDLPVAAEWGDAEKLEIGDWVLAIGSPFQLDQTVTAGIVSATGRHNLRIVDDGSGYEDFIQTDAAVNPGNSGGPLIDLTGSVIGINTAILSTSNEGNQGIGFAISSTLAKRVVDQLIRGGRVTRGYIGIQMDFVGRDRAKALGMSNAKGAYVVEIDPDSPADRAGLKPGDAITELEGSPVDDPSVLRSVIGSSPVGREIPVGYFRDGRAGKTTVKVAEMPVLRSLGLRLRESAPNAPEQALVIDQVVPGTPAQRANLQPGMQVISVGGQPVRTRAEADGFASRGDPARGIVLGIQAPDGKIVSVSVVDSDRKP
jgi:serine protease Do